MTHCFGSPTKWFEIFWHKNNYPKLIPWHHQGDFYLASCHLLCLALQVWLLVQQWALQVCSLWLCLGKTWGFLRALHRWASCPAEVGWWTFHADRKEREEHSKHQKPVIKHYFRKIKNYIRSARAILIYWYQYIVNYINWFRDAVVVLPSEPLLAHVALLAPQWTSWYVSRVKKDSFINSQKHNKYSYTFTHRAQNMEPYNSSSTSFLCHAHTHKSFKLWVYKQIQSHTDTHKDFEILNWHYILKALEENLMTLKYIVHWRISYPNRSLSSIFKVMYICSWILTSFTNVWK